MQQETLNASGNENAGNTGTTAVPDVLGKKATAAIDVLYYSCRKCRCFLFDSSNLDQHEINERHRISKKKQEKDRSPANARGATGIILGRCSSHFLNDSVEWMNSNMVEGKLLCPGCSSRIGSYDWSGSQCSCGTWITPALQIPKSKVDVRGNKVAATKLVNLQHKSSIADEFRDQCVLAHLKWSQQFIANKSNLLLQSMDLIEESGTCALTTIKGAVVKGKSDVFAALTSAARRLSGKLAIHSPPAASADEDDTFVRTECVYEIDGKRLMAESLDWTDILLVKRVVRSPFKRVEPSRAKPQGRSFEAEDDAVSVEKWNSEMARVEAMLASDLAAKLESQPGLSSLKTKPQGRSFEAEDDAVSVEKWNSEMARVEAMLASDLAGKLRSSDGVEAMLCNES